jgi:hypothetical protein
LQQTLRLTVPANMRDLITDVLRNKQTWPNSHPRVTGRKESPNKQISCFLVITPSAQTRTRFLAVDLNNSNFMITDLGILKKELHNSACDACFAAP